MFGKISINLNKVSQAFAISISREVCIAHACVWIQKTHIFDVTDKKNPPAAIETKKRKELVSRNESDQLLLKRVNDVIE